jgi:predicted transcriptional regulator
VAPPTTTFRLSDRDRRRLDRLAEELVCSRTDVLRVGLAALIRDPQFRGQVRADNIARAFLKSLRTQYGENAVLELIDDGDSPGWKLAGEPINPQVIDIEVRRAGDCFVMDLIDPSSGVGISNAASWTEADGSRHAVVSLKSLWLHSASGVQIEPKARQLYDGRTIVQIEEDDGTLKHLVLDHQGNSRLLRAGEVPVAAFRD